MIITKAHISKFLSNAILASCGEPLKYKINPKIEIKLKDLFNPKNDLIKIEDVLEDGIINLSYDEDACKKIGITFKF